MTVSALESALARLAEGYRERAPVFHVVSSSRDDIMREARLLTAGIWPQFGDCSPWVNVDGLVALARLPSDGGVKIFPSGAIEAAMFPPESRKPLATDERQADRKKYSSQMERIARAIAKERVAPDEELKLESVWENKGQAVTVRGGEKTPVALRAVVGAFRRYVHGLPVLGRASVHVGLGGATLVNRWGIDWRRREPKPFAETAIVSPEEGAKRILADMWRRRPERPFTDDDFTPVFFRLGYLAHSRRAEQRVLQPAWVAILKPQKGTTMGHVVAVSAAPNAFEPIVRPARIPRMVGIARAD
jgi:hypothetical protein